MYFPKKLNANNSKYPENMRDNFVYYVHFPTTVALLNRRIALFRFNKDDTVSSMVIQIITSLGVEYRMFLNLTDEIYKQT